MVVEELVGPLCLLLAVLMLHQLMCLLCHILLPLQQRLCLLLL